MHGNCLSIFLKTQKNGKRGHDFLYTLYSLSCYFMAEQYSNRLLHTLFNAYLVSHDPVMQGVKASADMLFIIIIIRLSFIFGSVGEENTFRLYL